MKNIILITNLVPFFADGLFIADITNIMIRYWKNLNSCQIQNIKKNYESICQLML